MGLRHMLHFDTENIRTSFFMKHIENTEVQLDVTGAASVSSKTISSEYLKIRLITRMFREENIMNWEVCILAYIELYF